VTSSAKKKEKKTGLKAEKEVAGSVSFWVFIIKLTNRKLPIQGMFEEW
jgi:hypothetical protein